VQCAKSFDGQIRREPRLLEREYADSCRPAKNHVSLASDHEVLHNPLIRGDSQSKHQKNIVRFKAFFVSCYKGVIMGVVVKLKDIDAPSDAINRVKQAILKAGERPGTPWPANFKESDFAALAFRTLKSLLPELNLPQERPAELSASGTDVVFDGGKSKIVFETRMREVDGKFYAELEGDFHEAVSGMLYDHDLLFVVLLPDDTTGRQAQAIRSYFSKHTHSQLFQSRALILNRSEVRGFLFGGSSASESGKQERSAESKKTEP